VRGRPSEGVTAAGEALVVVEGCRYRESKEVAGLDDIRQVRAAMDEKRLAALETLGAVVRWLRETKPSEIFYVDGEGKAGKVPVPTMSEEHLRVIWQRWVAKASDVLEKSAIIPDLLISDIERLFKGTGGGAGQAGAS